MSETLRRKVFKACEGDSDIGFIVLRFQGFGFRGLGLRVKFGDSRRRV